jgi:Fanconi anemia group M protein
LSEGLKICVDSNEASGRRDIVNYLRLAGFQVDVQKLDVCDYVVSDRCGVERKDVSDFLGSMKDGRLFSQAGDMARVYEKPVLVLEGRLSRAFSRSRMRPASVYGALASLVLDYGVSVVPTEGPDGTAVLLHRLAYREQVKEERRVQLRSVRRDLSPDQQQVFLLSGEVRVSASGKTRRLLGALADVRGVGPVIVERAQGVLNGSYRELCDLGEG